MAPGRYDWTFSVRLPPYIPASYEGQHGRVQYWGKAVLERRMKNDMDFTKNFTVLGALDLNTEPDAKVCSPLVDQSIIGMILWQEKPVIVLYSYCAYIWLILYYIVWTCLVLDSPIGLLSDHL